MPSFSLIFVPKDLLLELLLELLLDDLLLPLSLLLASKWPQTRMKSKQKTRNLILSRTRPTQ